VVTPPAARTARNVTRKTMELGKTRRTMCPRGGVAGG
jgi:hypothetical protein